MARQVPTPANAYGWVHDARAQGEAYAREHPVDPSAETKRMTTFERPPSSTRYAGPRSETAAERYVREIASQRAFEARGFVPDQVEAAVQEAMIVRQASHAPISTPPSPLHEAPSRSYEPEPRTPTQLVPVAPSARHVAAPVPDAPREAFETKALRARMQRCNEDALRDALRVAEGNRSEAARILGISREGMRKALLRIGVAPG